MLSHHERLAENPPIEWLRILEFGLFGAGDTHEMLTLVVTALTASVLGLFYLRLTMAVVRIRRSQRISIGNGENDALARAVRIHSNFAEYVPISLILLAVLEINGGPVVILLLFAAALILGRVLHPRGLSQDTANSMKYRTLGMQLTLYNLIALCAVNIFWIFYSWLG